MQPAEAWKDFFIAAAGASATLVGLVIVAVSVNLQRILEHPHLASRGGANLAALVLILVSSMATLVPQRSAALAVEIAVFGFLTWLIQLVSARQAAAAYLESRRPLHESVISIAIGQIQVIPFVVGGILWWMRQSAGPYWIAWGMIATFILSVVNVWVLLVEILR